MADDGKELDPSAKAPAVDAAAKEKADMENGAKVLGDMETGIRDKLMKMSDEFGAEFTKLHSAYIDMPDEIKAHVMYKPLGERISSIEALLNTLVHTAASFPMPIEPPVPHGSL
jgi:hypothetical protein